LSILALGLAVGVAIGVEGATLDRSTEAFASAARGSAEPPIVDCHTRLQVPGRRTVNRAAPRISIVAGPLVFSGVRRWGNVRRRMLDPRPGRLKAIKVPLLLKAGETVILNVLSPVGRYAETRVGLDEEPYETGGQGVELRSCPIRPPGAGRRRGGYLFFPAEFRIDGPMCLRITVGVEGRPAPISRRIAFGRDVCERRHAPGSPCSLNPRGPSRMSSLSV
jgi:hypothetical protein